MAWDSGGGDSKMVETRITVFLGPYEPIIMKIQSLLVWEYPWKSTVLFVAIHLLFWFMYISSVRFFFIVSVVLMVVVFVDTWKNRIWPEIRVAPKEPEDKDGWTPVHPRLLSVPEISLLVASGCSSFHRLLNFLRRSRINHPLLFCIGSTCFLAMTATVGCRVSGFTLVYVTTVNTMVWPSFIYHSLPSKLYHKMEPGLLWIKQNVPVTLGNCLGTVAAFVMGFLSLATGHGAEEEFVPQENQEMTYALSKALNDSQSDGNNSSSAATPGLSHSTSLNNSEDELSLDRNERDFALDINQMPSFDNLDNTDDELDLPPARAKSQKQHTSRRLSDLQFKAGHFGDSSGWEDERTLSEDVVGGNVNNSHTGAEASWLQLGGVMMTALTAINSQRPSSDKVIANTLTSMIDSAAGYLGQGQAVSSSSINQQTGAKMTYTRTHEGESFDLENREDTIRESEEEVSDLDLDQNEQIAEIEKDFDFLHDL